MAWVFECKCKEECMSEKIKTLEEFDEKFIGLSKGSLSLVLILTRIAQKKEFPLNYKEFVTPSGGQVAGLSGSTLRKILADHGIDRILSSEGGRTSRGNMERMLAYISLLNGLHATGSLSLKRVEEYWVERTRAYFDALPFTFKLDSARSLRACVRDLLDQAVERQREARGTMYAGAVMQHLVGAKLDYVTKGQVSHHGFSVADAPSNRSGDFLLGDVAIHVTTAPGEALIRKCKMNLEVGLRPLIITTEDGIGGAKALARQVGVDDRIDVIEIEQFVTTHLYDWSAFERENRARAVSEIIDRYNTIVAKCESDPSLRIDFDS